MWVNFLKNRAIFSLIGAILLCCLAPMAQAMTYVWSEKSDVIGGLQYTQVRGKETLLTLAMAWGVGYDAIKAANPGVNPKAPGQGSRVLIPGRHILPSGPREGIVINVAEKRLFHFTRPELGPPLISSYPISIGDEARAYKSGTYKILQRVRNPSWNVPENIKKARKRAGKEVIDVMPPGDDNPLGYFAMSTDGPGLIIHGTNRPWSIGRKVREGSIRLYPQDMENLINLTDKDTPVRIVNESLKWGTQRGLFFMEFHKPDHAPRFLDPVALVNKMNKVIPGRLWQDDWARLRVAATDAWGVGVPVMNKGKRRDVRVKPGLKLGVYPNVTKAMEIMRRVERMGVPMTVRCKLGRNCELLAGPFDDVKYMAEIKKRVKWITRVKAVNIKYRDEAVKLIVPQFPTVTAN